MTSQQAAKKVLGATTYSQIINSKSEYWMYASLLHPDKYPDGEEAFKRLSELRDKYEKGTNLTDEAGIFNVRERLATWDNGEIKLLGRSHSNWLKIQRMGISHLNKYIPSDHTYDVDKAQTCWDKRAVPIVGITLPQEHVNWILSRLLEFVMMLNHGMKGYMHGGICPESVLIVPETHGVIINSFYHMTMIDRKVETINGKYKDWYPSQLFSHKTANSLVDIELCKRVACYLLGDKSGVGSRLFATHDKEIIQFLRSQHGDPYKCYDRYREMIGRKFESKFLKLDI